MLTLTDASKETKTIFKWAAVVLAIMVVLFLLFRAYLIVKTILFPPPIPKAAAIFGKIPEPLFPVSKSNKHNYSVDTISGSLPKAPTQMKVFEIQKNTPDLLSLKQIGDSLASAGYSNGPFKYSDQLYFWTNSGEDFLKTIRVNIVTRDFTLFSPYYYDKTILSAKNLPNEKDSVNQATNFLSKINYLSDDIDLSKTQSQLLSLRNGQLSPANSFSTTQAIRVNFYQKDLDSLPVLYEKTSESNINLLITGGENTYQIVRGNFILKRPIKSSTYDVKDYNQALGDLKRGKAYIAADSKDTNIKIKNVYPAYFAGNTDQNFIYPIYVFEANNFLAYVSALTDEWLSN